MTNALIYLRVSCHFKELLQMSIVIYISCISIDNFKRKEKKNTSKQIRDFKVISRMAIEC